MWYGMSTLLVRGLQIILIPIYTRLLSSGDYGVIDTLTIVAALVNLTVALEIAQGMARFIAEAKDEAAMRSIATTAIAFAVFTYTAFAIGAVLLANPIAMLLFGRVLSQDIMPLAIAAIAVNGVFVVAQDLLRWQLKPRSFALASVSYTLGSACVSIWLVAGAGWGVGGVFAGQLAGAVAGGVVALFAARKLWSGRPSLIQLRVMLSYSVPLVFSGLAIFGNLFVDRMVIRSVLGLDALGVYGVAARLASIISVLAIGLQIALSPLVYRHWQQPGTAETLARVCRLYCCAMVPVVGGLSLFAPEILMVLTGPAFHGGAGILPLLAYAAMLGTLYVFAPGLFLSKRTHYVAWLNLVGVGINLIMSIFLASLVGAWGAAAAVAIASSFILTGYVLMGRRWFDVPYKYGRLSVSLGVLSATVLLATAQNLFVTEFDGVAIAGRGLVLLVACLAAFNGGLDRPDRALLWSGLRIIIRRSPRA